MFRVNTLIENVVKNKRIIEAILKKKKKKLFGGNDNIYKKKKKRYKKNKKISRNYKASPLHLYS